MSEQDETKSVRTADFGEVFIGSAASPVEFTGAEEHKWTYGQYVSEYWSIYSEPGHKLITRLIGRIK